MYKKSKPLKFGAILTISIILTLGFSISLQSLLASWTAPNDTPPSNNVSDLLIGGSIGVGTNISVVGSSTFLGNVGIGTTTNSNALHIYRQVGDAIVKISTDGIGNPALDISAATGRGSSIFFKEAGIEKGYIGHDPTNGALQFGDSTNRTRIILKEGGNTVFAGNTIDFNGQEIRHATYNPFYINSNDTIQFRINTNSTGGTGEFGVNRGNDNARVFTIKDSGNIGIGTSSPTSLLHIQKSWGSESVPMMYLKNTNDGDVLYVENTALSTQSDKTLADFRNGVGSVMYLRGDGNIGIGTPSPGAKLDVNGVVKARQGVYIPRYHAPAGTCNSGSIGKILISDADYVKGDPILQACSTSAKYNGHMYFCGARWNGSVYNYGWICVD